jgi:hypothetical protein
MLRIRDGKYCPLYRVILVPVLTHGHETEFLIALTEQTLKRQE